MQRQHWLLIRPRTFLLIRMDLSPKDAAFTISSRPHPLQKISGTLGPGLVIQQADRMCMFQAKPRAGVVISNHLRC